MKTFNFELNHNRTTKGTYAVLLRITENRKHTRLKTGVELTAQKHWNYKTQEVRKTDPSFQIKNAKLKAVMEGALMAEEKLINEGSNATSKKVISTMKDRGKPFSFLEFAERYATQTYEAGEYRTATKYITFLNKLKLFINGVSKEEMLGLPTGRKALEEYLNSLNADLLFSEITLSFLNKFKTYLHKIPKIGHPEQTLHPNYISKLFDNFKSLYNKGIAEIVEEGYKSQDNPFLNFECSTISTYKEKLTWEEIEALESLKLQKGSLLWHTRNCFLFAFYCCGMRAGDLIQLRGTNIIQVEGVWRLYYRMDKTSQQRDFELVDEALDILKNYIDLNHRTTDYIFPLLKNDEPYSSATTWEEKEQLPHPIKKKLLQHVNGKNSLLNNSLRILAKRAGIEKNVSMHIARHSFANIGRQMGANVYDLSKAMGHSNIKITEAYLANFDTKSQDETIEKVYKKKPQHKAKATTTKSELLEQLKTLTKKEKEQLLRELQK